ncbi:hypothetical protein YC2023_042521 [Brassica napus]
MSGFSRLVSFLAVATVLSGDRRASPFFVFASPLSSLSSHRALRWSNASDLVSPAFFPCAWSSPPSVEACAALSSSSLVSCSSSGVASGGVRGCLLSWSSEFCRLRQGLCLSVLFVVPLVCSPLVQRVWVSWMAEASVHFSVVPGGIVLVFGFLWFVSVRLWLRESQIGCVLWCDTVRWVYTVPVECKGDGNLWRKLLNDVSRLLLVPPVVSIFWPFFGFVFRFFARVRYGFLLEAIGTIAFRVCALLAINRLIA